MNLMDFVFPISVAGILILCHGEELNAFRCQTIHVEATSTSGSLLTCEYATALTNELS